MGIRRDAVAGGGRVNVKQPPSTTQSSEPETGPLIPQHVLRRNRKRFYRGAVCGALKLKSFIETSIEGYDESGRATPPIGPETVNAYQKLVGLAMLLGPLPGEAKFVAPEPKLSEPRQPETLDDVAGDVMVIRMNDHCGETTRRKKKTKAG
jgi:hypothetical protein